MSAWDVRNDNLPFKENYGVTDPSPLEPLIPETGPSSSAAQDATRIFRNDPVTEIEVTYSLPWFDLFQGALVGVSRRIDNLRKRNVHEPHGGPDDPWEADILGACGELAVARYVDRFWSGQLGNYKARDVGPLQVRTSHHENGRLILHETDHDDQIYILVVGELPSLTLAGWKYARDGKQPEFWAAPKGRWAFWVPQQRLEPMSTLLAELVR